MDKPIKKFRQSSPAAVQLLNLILVLSDKGGVGKSVIARTLLEYCLTRQIPVIACDCDRSNQSLLDYYQAVVPVLRAFFSEDPKKAWNADPIIEAMLEHQTDMIVDTPAQVFRSLIIYLQKGGLKAAQRQGIALILVLVIADRYSLEQAIDLIEAFGNSVSFIVALNEGCCDDFSFMDEHEECQATLQRHDIPLITIPELTYREREIIDHFRLPFSEALSSPDLTIVGRQRVADFLDDCFDQLDELKLLNDDRETQA